jgi:hypothetical protein
VLDSVAENGTYEVEYIEGKSNYIRGNVIEEYMKKAQAKMSKIRNFLGNFAFKK